ncbi:hypothetical protein V6N00_01830 [Tersicoccus sp. MR15.9]|uniref:hypothetical protein n=1 Tax=Tersicoccus mangrovi TaxID=3121635 RepID=UPI002FE5A89B
MSDLTAVTVAGSAHDAAADAPSSTYLCPTDEFPGLENLPLTAVQALHSRVCRQVDREYLFSLDGPSVETLDRQQELAEELDRRERQFVQSVTR